MNKLDKLINIMCEMNKPDAYSASDYAGLSFRGGGFYYGYEETSGENDEWCFSAKFDGVEIVIPFSKLGAKDMFNVNNCLLVGIGWVLAKYKLSL
ncbi:MAG: hypothetical protein PVG39_02205 [Desulfobacteraceae bacterium]|jgi:hypothetical protein